MAINIDTQDLENYPGITKRVTVDQAQIVPLGFEGDEKFVLKFTTTAYSDILNTTAIQDLYITDFITGWCKSSGFAGSGGKFDIDATHNRIKVKLDATVSGSDDSGYYEIILDYNDDLTPIDGSDIATDMESKIRALTIVTADSGFALSYTNCSVEYIDGKFYIISGSVASSYSGSNRSSVKVVAGSTNSCINELGFGLSLDSQYLNSVSVKETYITSNYTTDTTPLIVAAGTGVSAGDCFMIRDDVYTDYCTAISGTTDTSIVVPTMSTHNYIGITNSYTTTSGAKIQLLREQDVDGVPTMWHNSIDSVTRAGVRNIINQIDYSS